MNRFLFTITALVLSVSIYAQNQNRCATRSLLNQKFQENPQYKVAYDKHKQENNLLYGSNTEGTAAKTTQTNYVVPVIFHIILTQAKLNQLGGTSGVRDRMQSQLDVLNKDYNAKNADSTNIPSAFKPLYGNAGISFGPAHRSPTNASTEGFDIKITTLANFSINSNYGSDPKFPQYGGVDAWDPHTYYNIWVVDIAEAGLLGYTTPPSFINYGFSEAEFGVVLDYGAFGKRTSLTQFFSPNTIDLGRTLTHETGHFFELEHTFGEDSTCTGTGDDGIADTPPQSVATYTTTSACNTFPIHDACSPSGSGIMFMNYMDYVDDRCMNLFTKGQVNKMRDQFTSGIAQSLSVHPEVLQWPTGIAGADNNNYNINIYPNPSKGKFEVNIADCNSVEKITVFNTLGQMVACMNASFTGQAIFNLDLNAQPKGVYLVQIQTATGIQTKKIIIE